MHCRTIVTPPIEPGGQPLRVIVCGPRPRRRTCSACGTPRSATLQCDWIVKRNEERQPAATCDAWLCDGCSTKPAPDKDLCPPHAAEWDRRQQRRLNLTAPV